MQGNITKIIQSILYCIEYNPGTIDSIYGQHTKDAVCSYQSDNGLSVDGVTGKNTFRSLFA